jgi:Zn finger protein HypA/HybF involved in hydrogenase expression
MLLLKVEDFQSHVEQNNGYCIECDEITKFGGVEPDAEDYLCPQCGQNAVCGIEQALIRGFIEPAD